MVTRIILISVLFIPVVIIICKYIGVEDRLKEYKDNSDIR